MKIFHVFECRKERQDGTLCGWPMRVGEGRVPKHKGGRRATAIEDFCKRCRRQGRIQEGERCIFYLLRREIKDRRIIDDLSLAYRD